MSPNQVNAVKTANAAPRVVPQAVSVLGRSPSAFVRAPRPSAAVLSKPVVVRSTPPPPPVPFQRRQQLLERNPGHPIPIQRQQQIARAASAAARPPVKIVAQARPVIPTVIMRLLRAPRLGPWP